MNPTQLEHKVPLTCDMLSANSIILESHDLEGPYGAKEADMSIAISASQAYTKPSVMPSRFVYAISVSARIRFSRPWRGREKWNESRKD